MGESSFSVLQDTILDSILDSSFSILDSCVNQELRMSYPESRDSQWTVNLSNYLCLLFIKAV